MELKLFYLQFNFYMLKLKVILLIFFKELFIIKIHILAAME